MRIRVRSGDARSASTELVILPLAAGEEDGSAVRALARAAGRRTLRRAISANRFRGHDGQVATVSVHARRTACLVGLGDPARLDADAWRRAAGRGRKVAGTLGARRVSIVVDERAHDASRLEALVEGFGLAGYRFDKYRSANDVPPPVDELTLVAPAPPPERALAARWRAVEIALAAVTTVRDLVNEPAAVKTPAYIGGVAERLGREAGVEVEVWNRKRIEAERLAGLLAVARGSDEEPRFMRLRYAGEGARLRVALVGKGITFDSGGLSLKPAKSMETMKCDMAGGAVVLAVLAALGRSRPAIDVEGFVPVTENLPSGSAQKPGDVIRFRNGKTVEVLNTDAEGRLVLADALTLAAATKPDVIIDLATLTGACIVALGPQVAGIFGNHQPTIDRLLAIGREAGEPLWQLPLVADYRDDIKSAVADLKNVGGGNAGSITAALFLQEFVGAAKWVHLDIAGPAFTEKDLAYAPKGGTGFGVRTLLRYLHDLAADGEAAGLAGRAAQPPRRAAQATKGAAQPPRRAVRATKGAAQPARGPRPRR